MKDQPEETEPEKTAPEKGDGEFTYSYENGILIISGKGALGPTALETCGAKKDVLEIAEEVQGVLEDGVAKIEENALIGCKMIRPCRLSDGLSSSCKS